jgi:hypothetical protein
MDDPIAAGRTAEPRGMLRDEVLQGNDGGMVFSIDPRQFRVSFVV